MTYRYQGCKKRGVKANKHGIIYNKKSNSEPLPGEPEMGFKPIKARIPTDGQSLQSESRVHYSKILTVEHNVRIFIVGAVTEDSLPIFRNAVDSCWNARNNGDPNGQNYGQQGVYGEYVEYGEQGEYYQQ